MMTRNEINTYLAAILTTLLETELQPVPLSAIYLAVGSDMSKFSTLRDLMVAGGLVKVTTETIVLTVAGGQLARRIEATLTK